jgi:DNA-binding transcriptional LysR family regulator
MTAIQEKTTGLLAFVRTVETASFTNAGRVIGSSPSAIAKSVARLERLWAYVSSSDPREHSG